VASRPRSRGRYDGPEGGTKQSYLVCCLILLTANLLSVGQRPLVRHDVVCNVVSYSVTFQRSPERNAAPSVQELQRLHPSSVPNPRRERQAPVSPVVTTQKPRSKCDGLSPSSKRSRYLLGSVATPCPSIVHRWNEWSVNLFDKPCGLCLTLLQSRSGPSDAEFPPTPPPAPTPSREWIPRQPEFLSNLPPPSTRLPGAPPPPVLPTLPYVAPLDPTLHPLSQAPHDENILAKPESEAGRLPPHEQYRQESPSPVRQTMDIPPSRSYQKKEGCHEQTPAKPSSLDSTLDRTSRGPAGNGLKENPGKESHKPSPREDSRPKVSSELIPRSWDVAPPPASKPLALPASLPPKPVAALGDLNLQQSSSLRTGHNSHGRRSQQQPSDESNGHRTRWGPSRRGDGGKDKERERNRWEPAPEYRGPSLLARMSSSDSIGRAVTERVEKEGGGEVHRKRARTRKYQAS